MSSASVQALPPDERKGDIINIVGWVGAAISILCVVLRIYSRLFITRSPGWDDAILVFAAVFKIINTALNTVSVSYGIGRHVYYLSDDDIVDTLYYESILRPIGIAAIFLPKLAVVILIIRLMGTAKRGVWCLYSVIGILFITFALAIILFFAQCSPADHLWHPFSPADCFPSYVIDGSAYVAAYMEAWKLISFIFGAWSAFTDFVLAVFPATILWNLQMKRSKNISIMLLMGLGFFIEADLVIMAACAPALPKLVLRILGRDTEESPKQDSHPYSIKPDFHGYHAFDNRFDSAGIGNIRGGIAC
ncbi:hypothetical protein N8I77_009811 [Diaporthe amygdali]|uniref:Rhodopsin domain-containing protein n=1 Tax=Phomopsis amygdali TaxID=1214568 RepID=A0AAD9SAX9_PHOAM|nr:hypothetical protein N8I77_009811 [Diaporthe amygdali]